MIIWEDGIEEKEIQVKGNKIKNIVTLSLGGHEVIGKLSINLLTKESFKLQKIKHLQFKDLKTGDFALKEKVEAVDFISSEDLIKELMSGIQEINIPSESSTIIKGKDSLKEKVALISKLSEENAVVGELVEKYIEVVSEYNNLTNSGKKEKPEDSKKEETNTSGKSEE